MTMRDEMKLSYRLYGERKEGESVAEIQISLAAARVNAGMTQEEAAERMHVSKRTIVNWEKGVVIPSFANINMLSGIYKIPEDNIFLPNKST